MPTYKFRLMSLALVAGVTTAVSSQQRPAREMTADQQVQHVLNRLAFGPRPGDVEAVRRMGVDAWIARQLEPEKVPDTLTTRLLAGFRTLGKRGEELLAEYPPPGAALAKKAIARRMAGDTGSMLSAADSAQLRKTGRESYAFLGEIATSRVIRATTSERQLQEVMTDFWENHFNVFAGKDRTRYFLPEYDAMIRAHSLGKFRDLLGAVAKSPAMLVYLDNYQSVADSGRPTLGGRQGDALRARAIQRAAARGRPLPPGVQQALGRRRGVNENYARELMELHTLGVDGGYTQNDVINVARVLTGWTLERGANGGDFTFRAQTHDAGEKTILGKRFAAGRGQDEGEDVLDMLARHPATAKFIATKLARRFVTDTPSAALVERVASTFRRTDGDIRETMRTLITSPEFFATSAYRAKVKSPFELVVSTLRVMNAVPDTTPRVSQLVSRLGQPIFGHQAPNGWPETGDAWMNTGAILNRINFGLAVAGGRVPGLRLQAWPATSALSPLARPQQVDGVIRELLGGAASSDTRQVLLTGTNPFLQSRAAEAARMTDSLGGDVTNGMSVSTNTMGTTSATGDINDAATKRADRRANGKGKGGSLSRAQQSAGREAVKPTGMATLAQSIGTVPQLSGLAQIVGLAIGAPEFQRR